jgi:hypothetical protein
MLVSITASEICVDRTALEPIHLLKITGEGITVHVRSSDTAGLKAVNVGGAVTEVVVVLE